MKEPDKAIFEIWLDQADQALLRGYGIDFDDAGLGEEDLRRHCAKWPDSNEFVEWFAIKCDLDPLPLHLRQSGRLRSPLRP